MEKGPQPTTFKELKDLTPKIVQWAACNPGEDYVMYIKTSAEDIVPTNCVIAGSAALYQYLSWERRDIKLNWKPGDTDLFVMGASEKDVRIFHDLKMDVLFIPDTKVEDLLLRFDIPPTRIAYDFFQNLYISAQCVASIQTRRYVLPATVKDMECYVKLFREKHDVEIEKDLERFEEYTKILRERGVSEDEINKFMTKPDSTRMYYHGPDHYHDRLMKRIKKYKERGFGVDFSDKIEPKAEWMLHRFTY